jgi:cytochrome c6
MSNTIFQSGKRLTAASLLVLSGCFFSPARSSAQASSGAATFKAKCVMCHGQDGSGKTPMGLRLKIRDLRSPEVQKQTDDELNSIITNGKPPMAAYGKTLGAAEIQQLVAYLRTLPKA